METFKAKLIGSMEKLITIYNNSEIELTEEEAKFLSELKLCHFILSGKENVEFEENAILNECH